MIEITVEVGNGSFPEYAGLGFGNVFFSCSNWGSHSCGHENSIFWNITPCSRLQGIKSQKGELFNFFLIFIPLLFPTFLLLFLHVSFILSFIAKAGINGKFNSFKINDKLASFGIRALSGMNMCTSSLQIDRTSAYENCNNPFIINLQTFQICLFWF